MTKDKLFCAAVAVVLAAVISIAGIGCLVTAFDLEPNDWTHMVWMTVLIAVISGACLFFRFGEVALTLLVMLLGYLAVQRGDLLLSLEKLLGHITTYYDNAYGCGVMRWSWENLNRVDPDTALIVMAALPAMAVCWTLLRRQWFGFAVIPAFFPLALCCIVTDTVPDDLWLWLLLTALLLLVMTQRLRRITHRDANRLTALLLVPVMLLTGVLFRFTTEEMYLEQAQSLQLKLFQAIYDLTGKEFGTGGNGPAIPGGETLVSNVLDLSQLNGEEIDDSQVMSVKTTDVDGVLYLRGQAFDRYTGKTWDASISAGENGWPAGDFVRMGQVTVKTQRVLPLRYFPYYLNIPNWDGDMENGYYPNYDMTEYTFTVNAPGAHPNPGRLTTQEREQYLELPRDTENGAKRLLNRAKIDLGLSDERLAQAIADYVRGSAVYDLATGKMPADEDDFALWFLQDGESGYCVHFATATAVLLRAAGIPARYVTGYMTKVVAGAECAVLQSQAHAWVEYYHPEQGWTMLESTPVDPQEPVILVPPTDPTEPTETTRPTKPTVPTETVPTDPTETTKPTFSTGHTDPVQTTVPTDPITGETLAPTQGATAPTVAADPEEPEIRLNLKWIKGILMVLAAWLLIAGQYKLRLWLRKRQMKKGSPNRQALCRWRHVRRISKVSGWPAESVLPLAEKAAFSQHELTGEELAQFDRWFKDANLALLEKPWVIQFILRLIFAVE